MHTGAIASSGIEDVSRVKILQQRARSADVARVAMSKQEAVKLINPAHPQIFANQAAKIALRAAIEEPIRLPRANVRRATGAEVENSQFCGGSAGPVWPLHVEMAAG